MICQDVQERLTDALLGEAPPSVREELLDHAAGCAGCADAAEQLRRTLELLRASSWPAETVLGEAERRRLFERARARRRPIGWIAAAAASLVAAAVMAAVGVPALRRLRVEPTPPVTEPAPATVARAADPLPPRPSVQIAPAPAPSVVPSQPPASPVPPPASVAVPGKGAIPDAPAVARRPAAEGILADQDSFIDRARAEAEARRQAAPADEGARAALLAGDRVESPAAAPRTALIAERGRSGGWVATERDAISTFGLDVDTASYASARLSLQRGELPAPGSVRVEEFVNALDADEPDPGPETFGIGVEATTSPFDGRRAFLRIGIRAREASSERRSPARLVFVVALSGSTQAGDRLELLKRSLQALVEHLDERDTIGLVTSGPQARMLLEPTPASQRTDILEAVQRLQAEGSGRLDAGLGIAYAMAWSAPVPQAVNRVVLCSDGIAGDERTDLRPLLDQFRTRARGRVRLMALGLGLRNGGEALLQRLAREGRGTYASVADLAGAKRVFLRHLADVLPVVAGSARAEVEFDPQRVESYRLLGYEGGGAPEGASSREAAGDPGEVVAGQTVAALYELRLSFGQGDLGAVRVRFVQPGRGPSEVQRMIGDVPQDGRFEDASSQLQLTVLAARFAEHLQRSRHLPPGERLEDLVRVTQRLPSAALRRPDGWELAGLIGDAAGLARQRGRD